MFLFLPVFFYSCGFLFSCYFLLVSWCLRKCIAANQRPVSMPSGMCAVCVGTRAVARVLGCGYVDKLRTTEIVVWCSCAEMVFGWG